MFDEQPDGDIHGECALEIKNLHARIAELSQQLEDADKKRLDWMEKNLIRDATIRLSDCDMKAVNAWAISSAGKNLREAIDAMIAATERNKP